MRLPVQNRPKSLDYLRLLIPRMEDPRMDGHVLPFGLPELDRNLPRGGLALEAVHEILPETAGDTSSAFGFMAALLGRVPPRGPVLLVASRRGLADCGRPHGHGLNALGLDPARLILVEAGDERQALWALEEALRSGAPVAVAGAVGRGSTSRPASDCSWLPGVPACPFCYCVRPQLPERAPRRPAGASAPPRPPATGSAHHGLAMARAPRALSQRTSG